MPKMYNTYKLPGMKKRRKYGSFARGLDEVIKKYKDDPEMKKKLKKLKGGVKGGAAAGLGKVIKEAQAVTKSAGYKKGKAKSDKRMSESAKKRAAMRRKAKALATPKRYKKKKKFKKPKMVLLKR